MRKLVCAAAACCVLAGSTTALASPDFVLDGTSAEMSGKYVFRKFHLINGAKLTLKKGTDAQPDAGKLYVIAHEIVIDDTSSIDGTGAGYPGQPNGNGLPLSNGGKGALEGSDSGGGGAYAGKGGPGVLAGTCTIVVGAEGGKPFSSETDVSIGSSGAAAGSKDGDVGGRGGAGGGLVDLRASSIKLLGQVIVDGEAGKVYEGDDSSGGGSAGGIRIETSLFDAAAGGLLANGAPGGSSSKDEGGSGGGGLILLRVQPQATGFVTSVIAGASTCAAAKGGDGEVKRTDVNECLDLDKDGVTSKACGGQDCDDSDNQVNPGGTEVCNGQDDDCDGEADDGADADCPGGACVGGKCVVADGGEPGEAGPDAPEGGTEAGEAGSGSDAGVEAGEDGGGPKSEPEIYEFRGGCAQARGAGWGGVGGVMLGAALIFAARFASIRRRLRRTGTLRRGRFLDRLAR